LGEIRADPDATADLALLADAARRPDNDPFALAEHWTPTRGAALYFDCGRDDFLFRANEDFHARLETLAVPHEYHVHDGDHNWAYWDLHIRDALAFAGVRLFPDAGAKVKRAGTSRSGSSRRQSRS